jgi:hypothetical protein
MDAGISVPPASGKNPVRAWNSPPSFSVSLPRYRPSSVVTSAKTPRPRERPGFHEYGRPLTGSSAASPLRGTALGAAESWPSVLFSQR